MTGAGGARGRGILAAGQAGVALVTALILVAVATVAAVGMASTQLLNMRMTGNTLQADQAYLTALGAEAWARQVLLRDARQNRTDAPGDDWAVALPPVAVEGGSVAGRIEDLGGRFNLNGLLTGAGVPDPLAVARFTRLLRILDIDPGVAAAVVDWLDADRVPGFPGGAEDEAYLGRDPAYRAANGPMASISELRLVAGIDGAAYQRLAPHVAALPGRAAINVNSATPELLRSLAEGIEAGDAETLVAARGEAGFETVAEFLAEAALAGRAVDEAGLSVASRHFLLTAEVRIGGAFTRHQALLERDETGKRVRTVRRSMGAE